MRYLPLIFVLVASAALAEPLRPNIVLIFVDDLGYGDLGCYGSTRNQTPHIDALAKGGQRWTSFYSSGSTCVPSRKGLMSGRHPSCIPRQTNGLKGAREQLMPAMLRRQGYRTAILGKWHLAGYPEDFTQNEMHPLNCGFDYHFGTPGSNDVPAPKGRKQNRALFDECTPITFPVPLIRGREIVEYPVNQELLTQRYTQQAVTWIRKQTADPFFLYLAHNMPHAPVFASPSFQGKSSNGRFGDVIQEIDWSVGQVIKVLKETGRLEDTLVIFTSDNGPWTVFGPHAGVAGPLRGEKATTWEGGQRIPAIFSWPGRITPATVDGIAANLDLYATFAVLAGGSQPTSAPGYISMDLTPVLLDGQPSPRTTWAFHDSAWRSGHYKIHLSTRLPTDPVRRGRRPVATHDPPLLFDLSSDIGERKNIAARHPEVVRQLLKERSEFRARQGLKE